MFLIFIFP